jgi:hypothetical protein
VGKERVQQIVEGVENEPGPKNYLCTNNNCIHMRVEELNIYMYRMRIIYKKKLKI